jgi:murein DD-endopeptidase MepM/ murein hydrolase activator NlpD
MPTTSQVFQSKNLWQWFNSTPTNSFDGVSEKGQDFASAYGTPIGVAVGGKVVRQVHNANSIGDVVEVQASDGSVWLYQHITATTHVGQTLNVGDVVGRQNGLPIDQYSTGSHIEVRYLAPGKWNAAIDSWSQPWQNPANVFKSIGGTTAGTTSSNLIAALLSAGGFSGGSAAAAAAAGKPVVTLAPNADVTQLLQALDAVLTVTNPFLVQQVTLDQLTVPAVGSVSFPDPLSWIEGFGTNLVDDLIAVIVRSIFILIGVFILYKVVSHFIDFGAIAETGIQAAKLGAMFA